MDPNYPHVSLPLPNSLPLATTTSQHHHQPPTPQSSQLAQLLQSYGVALEKTPPAIVTRLALNLPQNQPGGNNDQDISSFFPEEISPVDKILANAKELYRREVESRKQDQIRKHYEKTGQTFGQISQEMSRKLTNRATAGAGKKKNQELLANFETFSREEYEANKKTTKFLLEVLKENEDLVKRARALLGGGNGFGAMVELGERFDGGRSGGGGNGGGGQVIQQHQGGQQVQGSGEINMLLPSGHPGPFLSDTPGHHINHPGSITDINNNNNNNNNIGHHNQYQQAHYHHGSNDQGINNNDDDQHMIEVSEVSDLLDEEPSDQQLLTMTDQQYQKDQPFSFPNIPHPPTMPMNSHTDEAYLPHAA